MTTQQDILDLFDRILPEWYINTLKNPGPGYELLQAYAKMFERLSVAIVNDLTDGNFILQATGGAFSTGTVQFSRPTFAAGAVTVKAGSLVKTSVGGRTFILTADVVFGPTDLGPIDGPVTAIAPGWEWNTDGQITTARNEIIPGEIDTITLPLLDPPFGDTTIIVSQLLPTTGGIGAMLDQLGLDRGIPRSSPVESDPHYRVRIRTLPDVVSLDAIIRQVNAYMAPYLPSYDAAANIIETFDITYQTCWLAPPVIEGGPANEQPGAIPTGNGFNPNLFTYDDPRSSPPFNDRWLDEEEQRGTFILVVPNMAAFQDVGMAWDDTAVGPNDLITPNGRRAVAAWDVPSTLISTELQGGYDGFDLKKQAFYLNLFNLLQSIKAAGITAIIELEGQ